MAYKSLYQFTVKQEKEVDETTTKTEDGKTITETVKVKKTIPVQFSFKLPSRPERELAEEERAAWWSRYVEKGILPQALLLKTYANYGGILSKEDHTYYHGLQLELLETERKIQSLRLSDKFNEDEAKALDMKFIETRESIIRFEQEQAVFFDNTAEAKARKKMIEYLVLYMSHFKPDENGEWEPFFKGQTTEEKLKDFDKKVEAADELYSKSRTILESIAAIYVVGNRINEKDIDEILKNNGIVE